ncbi:TonB system transport protein ExbD [Rhodoblastus acidophilus]|uniref:Biopolymer transport protein ExbD n=1 Tax=Candidatus Rhodoblastus alkanivorans TaxID=2954117 RepID=A0ABS9Z6B4_9HYPH|nr:TonB system transport protein ExbD [Candidatus Rhodoblastus alkanivorans]MCI4678591.1 TonB system transport protein ExbD [Candidatus Rhodoblastus alkanivorans]MCI4683001.1 TonB system transport protein ExbD [Candidatus Rhodoblastus alkanivorans]MDI4640311.1 TonB system transport protein ExbD [Rhodoblastus acidophilus]
MSARLDHGGDDLTEIHDINVTPFIDVILVLLIIFMIAAPLSTVDVPVNLPSANGQPQPKADKPVTLTLKADLSLALSNQTVARTDLAAAVARATEGDKDPRLYLRADKSVPYGEVMRLMNELRAAGYLKLALVGLESDGPP